MTEGSPGPPHPRVAPLPEPGVDCLPAAARCSVSFLSKGAPGTCLIFQRQLRCHLLGDVFLAPLVRTAPSCFWACAAAAAGLTGSLVSLGGGGGAGTVCPGLHLPPVLVLQGPGLWSADSEGPSAQPQMLPASVPGVRPTTATNLLHTECTVITAIKNSWGRF